MDRRRETLLELAPFIVGWAALFMAATVCSCTSRSPAPASPLPSQIEVGQGGHSGDDLSRDHNAEGSSAVPADNS